MNEECTGSATGQHHWRRLVSTPTSGINIPWPSQVEGKLSRAQRQATVPEDWQWCPACDRLQYDPREA